MPEGPPDGSSDNDNNNSNNNSSAIAVAGLGGYARKVRTETDSPDASDKVEDAAFKMQDYREADKIRRACPLILYYYALSYRFLYYSWYLFPKQRRHDWGGGSYFVSIELPLPVRFSRRRLA